MMGIHWYTPSRPGFLHGGQVPCSVPTGDPLGIPWGSKGHVPEVGDIPEAVHLGSNDNLLNTSSLQYIYIYIICTYILYKYNTI